MKNLNQFMTTGVFAYKDKQKEYILANFLKPTIFFFFFRNNPLPLVRLQNVDNSGTARGHINCYFIPLNNQSVKMTQKYQTANFLPIYYLKRLEFMVAK